MVELVRSLPSDFSPLVVCPSPDGIYLELKELGVDCAIAPHGAWRKLGGRLTVLFRQLPALRRLVRSFKPDLIHANEFHIIPQAFASSESKCPVTGHVRLAITPRQVRNYHLDRCQGIATVSQAVKELIPESSLSERIQVVYNGVDVGKVGEEGPIPGEIAQWIESLGEPRPLIAGLFGLVSERKNQAVAVEAIRLARARGARVALLLAGDPFKGSMAYGDNLREILKSGDLRGNVLWLPFQKDVPGLYRGIDLNLLISGEEGFGRTIIEAGAAGKPSIGSRIGGIPELIRGGETGWLVEKGNAEDLAERLVALSANRDVLARCGAAARDHVTANFTIEAHTRAMIAFWERAAGRFHGGTHPATSP